MSEEQHLAILNEVLSRLEKAGVRLKSVFMAGKVTYLGHRLNREGIQPTGMKVEAINQAPKPRNLSELRAFLGMVNFYGKFIPDPPKPVETVLLLEHLW